MTALLLTLPTATTAFSRTSLVDSLCNASLRRFLALAWSAATRFFLRARCAIASFGSISLYGRPPSYDVPSDITAAVLMPKSTPIAPVGADGCRGTSQHRLMYQRPKASCENEPQRIWPPSGRESHTRYTWPMNLKPSSTCRMPRALNGIHPRVRLPRYLSQRFLCCLRDCAYWALIACNVSAPKPINLQAPDMISLSKSYPDSQGRFQRTACRWASLQAFHARLTRAAMLLRLRIDALPLTRYRYTNFTCGEIALIEAIANPQKYGAMRRVLSVSDLKVADSRAEIR